MTSHVVARLKLGRLFTCVAAQFLLANMGHAGGALPPGCGALKHNYGPFDYRTHQSSLPIVEQYHFTPDIEGLTSAAGNPGGDLGYTLQAFPNHPRALMTLIRYGELKHSDRPGRLPFTIECFMLRAEVFAPDDPMVKLISGIYYLKHGKAGDAIERLEQADALGSANPNLYYNLGLAYLDVGQNEKALVAAHKAYAAGFPLPGLRNRLKRAGVWRDIQPQAAEAAPSKVESAPPASAAQ